MKLEDKIKLSKANHKLWIKNLEKYGKLDSKRINETITEEELDVKNFFPNIQFLCYFSRNIRIPSSNSLIT